MDDKARERGNREIKESIDEFRKCFAAIDADVTELKGRMEKSKAVSIFRLNTLWHYVLPKLLRKSVFSVISVRF